MALIEWLYYGLENLSFYLYPCMNSMLDSVVNTINPKQSSLWEKCKQAFTSTLLSTSGIYDTSINIMFNLDQFCQILNTYTNDCRMDRFQFSEIPADILNIESSKNTNNKITLERLFSKKNVLNKMIEYKIHPVNPNVADKELISNLNNVSNCIFFEHLFLEIKECVFMIENLTYNIDLRNIKDTLSIVHDYVENISEVSFFALNECTTWLNQLTMSSLSSIECLIPLIQTYLKVINGFRMTAGISIPDISGIEWAKEHLHVLLLQASIRSLDTITLKRQRFLSCYSKNKLLTYNLTPHFPNYQHLAIKHNSGSQQKALGTGFYRQTLTDHTVFIKRTTKLNFLADDFAEILASSLSSYLGTSSFARCEPVMGTTNEVYIASDCSSGFSPLMLMKSRITTRLLPTEINELFSHLSENDLHELRNIILMCTLLADPDPNPGNIGMTNDEGLKKIDHGWAFDQICKPYIATWHDTLNPLRYPGRIAPTNAICDYKKIFKNYDFSFIRNIAQTINSPEYLREYFFTKLTELSEFYLNTKATGSLKENIELKDIIKTLSQRFGLAFRPEIDLAYIAHKLSNSIYLRCQNIYLLCILENIKDANTERLRILTAMLKNHLDFIIQMKIKVFNLRLIRKYCKITKSIIRNDDLHNQLDTICDIIPKDHLDSKLSDDVFAENTSSYSLDAGPSEDYSVISDECLATSVNASSSDPDASVTDLFDDSPKSIYVIKRSKQDAENESISLPVKKKMRTMTR
ncbi:MAG: hypothetical protein HYX61_04555 [Gammaproteobacteria bacterium]|jgi:hypothetical protein|nr:hypothetical protein [Gammaproteobacteria bacterium]